MLGLPDTQELVRSDGHGGLLEGLQLVDALAKTTATGEAQCPPGETKDRDYLRKRFYGCVHRIVENCSASWCFSSSSARNKIPVDDLESVCLTVD
jgi:hypothetical protein